MRDATIQFLAKYLDALFHAMESLHISHYLLQSLFLLLGHVRRRVPSCYVLFRDLRSSRRFWPRLCRLGARIDGRAHFLNNLLFTLFWPFDLFGWLDDLLGGFIARFTQLVAIIRLLGLLLWRLTYFLRRFFDITARLSSRLRLFWADFNHTALILHPIAQFIDETPQLFRFFLKIVLVAFAVPKLIDLFLQLFQLVLMLFKQRLLPI